MLYCGRVDISRRIDPTKSDRSKEYMIFQYCFFNHGFKFQDYFCNGNHDFTNLFLDISGIALSR